MTGRHVCAQEAVSLEGVGTKRLLRSPGKPTQLPWLHAYITDADTLGILREAHWS